ncbi:MAG: GLPGLI family protein [Bacteroides sp.]
MFASGNEELPYQGGYTFQQKVGLGGLYRYEDKGINIQWNLEDGERTIEGYQCKKATCTHRGRSYVAWYAPALAMGEGPYVFGGLPGLILELYETRDHYHFTMNGMQKVEGNDPLYLIDENVEQTTRDAFRKMLVNMNSNPGAIQQALKAQGITYTPSPEAQKRMSKPRPFNPIELE